MQRSKIYILHENDEWTAPLIEALQDRSAAFEAWHLNSGHIDLSQDPPPGVFYNRMSASSHTRGHRHAPEFCACVLDWLEAAGRRVLNGRRALQLELSKIAQYTALASAGVATPRTAAAIGRQDILRAAESFDGPFISKHNRAGRGLGVHLFHNTQALADHLASPAYEPSPDGILLIQQYIAAPEPFITRVEFVGREFLYAVRVDTSRGFELCPCDAESCATDSRPRFEILEHFEHANLTKYRQFMVDNQVDVAAFELILDDAGRAYTYDVNTNTNYNRQAEQSAGIHGMRRLAGCLVEELRQLGQAPSTHRRGLARVDTTKISAAGNLTPAATNRRGGF